MQPEEYKGEPARSLVLPALLAVLIIGWAYYTFIQHADPQPVLPPVPSDIEITRADTGNQIAIPTNFPTDIPVGTPIIESYSMNYASEHAMQYTVAFRTTQPVQDILKQYTDYFGDNQYVIASSSAQYLVGTKGGQTLSVTLPSQVAGEYTAILNLLVH